jgi:hypothetical protein
MQGILVWHHTIGATKGRGAPYLGAFFVQLAEMLFRKTQHGTVNTPARCMSLYLTEETTMMRLLFAAVALALATPAFSQTTTVTEYYVVQDTGCAFR